METHNISHDQLVPHEAYTSTGSTWLGGNSRALVGSRSDVIVPRNGRSFAVGRKGEAFDLTLDRGYAAEREVPAPIDLDPTKGILEMIDMESYRIEMQHAMQLTLPDDEGVIDPAKVTDPGFRPELEMDRLSNVVKSFNDQFGNIEWKDPDKIRKLIIEEIPAKVATDTAYKNAIAQGDSQTARIEHDLALKRVIAGLLQDHSELFKHFSENDAFSKFITDTSFNTTFKPGP